MKTNYNNADDFEEYFNYKKYNLKPRNYGQLRYFIEKRLKDKEQKVMCIVTKYMKNFIESLELIKEETFDKITYTLEADKILVKYENLTILVIIEVK